MLSQNKRKAKKSREELDQITFFQLLFNETLAHEMGEAVYDKNPAVKAAWARVYEGVPAVNEIPNEDNL